MYVFNFYKFYLFETLYDSIHRCANFVMRDGLNLEKAQSLILKAMLCDLSSIPEYSESRKEKHWRSMIREMREAIEAKRVQNYHGKTFQCPCEECNESFKTKTKQIAHTLNDCPFLSK